MATIVPFEWSPTPNQTCRRRFEQCQKELLEFDPIKNQRGAYHELHYHDRLYDLKYIIHMCHFPLCQIKDGVPYVEDDAEIHGEIRIHLFDPNNPFSLKTLKTLSLDESWVQVKMNLRNFILEPIMES